MGSAHRLGFDPDQPGVQALLESRARADEGEVEIEIMKGPLVVRPVGRWCGRGERVVVPKRFGDGLVERGCARRLGRPS